jgi:hypothetical protein
MDLTQVDPCSCGFLNALGCHRVKDLECFIHFGKLAVSHEDKQACIVHLSKILLLGITQEK